MRHVCDLYFNIRLNDVSLQMKPIWVTFISIIKLNNLSFQVYPIGWPLFQSLDCEL